jgi:hypothetical protein
LTVSTFCHSEPLVAALAARGSEESAFLARHASAARKFSLCSQKFNAFIS